MADDPTRRSFLKSAAALALASATGAAATRPTEAEAQSALRGQSLPRSATRFGANFVYVGSYTLPYPAPMPPDSVPYRNGEGIYRFVQDPDSGELRDRTLVARTHSPSWLVMHPERPMLYAVNEWFGYGSEHEGSVSAFAVDPESGSLTLRNVVASGGAAPVYISLDARGDFAFVANYASGTLAVLPIHQDGSLGEATMVHRDTGSVGATRATSGPPGSFAISGHDAPHAHMIMPDPAHRFVFSTDLGQDRIYSHCFDARTGRLTPNPAQPYISLPTGDGPRHFTFHPNQRWFYSIEEEGSTVTFFDYDREHGTLRQQQRLSSLPAGFAGSNFASEIAIAPNGRALYALNRLHNAISIFAIEDSGRLAFRTEVPTRGDYPRSFAVDPGGRFLYVCNKLSDNLTHFRIDRESAMLEFTGHYTAAPTPACMLFARGVPTGNFRL